MELADAEPYWHRPACPPIWPSTYNEDQNIGVGVPYTRAAEFRVAYHAQRTLGDGSGY